MAYTRNEGIVNGGGVAPENAGAAKGGRVTGVLLIVAAVLTVAMFWLPVMTFRFHGSSSDVYVWKSGGQSAFTDYLPAVPYGLMVIVAGVTGTLLAVGMGARHRVLLWAAAFAGGLVLLIASADVVGDVESFNDLASPAFGFWVIMLVMLVGIAALAMGLRAAAVSKRGAAQESGATAGGGAVDRVAGVFLIVAAVVNLAGSFLPLVPHDSTFVTVWSTPEDGSLPLAAVHFALASIAVFGVAIALVSGIGARNQAVRAASGAAAAFLVANAVSTLSSTLSVTGLSFWDYVGGGFWLAAVTLVLSFAATVAGLVAQLARPHLTAQPRMGYAPGYAVPNPFAQAAPAANPFAPAAAAPNPFATATPPPNPFAPMPSAPEVEATVKITPPPRMAKVYEGKDGEGRPVVNRPALEGNTRTAVLSYLESAPIVLAARSFEQDEFAPADKDVPLTFRTDGVWVWAGAVAHYLHKHGVAPEPELVQHIASRGFQVGEVGDDAKQAAIRVITGS